MTSQLLPAGTAVYWQGATPQHQRAQPDQALADSSPDGQGRWSPQLHLLYANPAFAAQTGWPPAGQPGGASPEAGFSAAVAAAWATQLRQVFAIGQPQELTGSWPTPAGKRHYHARFVPELLGGRLATVLAISRDTTAQWHRQQEAGQARRQQQELARQTADKYRALCDSMSEGLCVLEPLYDEAQQPVDFRYLDVNPAFARQTGLHDAPGRTLRELVPGVEPRWPDLYGRVARTGQPAYLEDQVGSLDRWFAVSAFALGAPPNRHVAVLFADITDRKRAEQARQEKAARQAYLLALSDALQAAAAATEVQATVANTALRYFRADCCFYGEITGDVVLVRQDAARPGFPSVAAAYSLSGIPLFGEVLHGNQPVVVADVRTSALLDDNLRQLCFGNRIQACLNVPVLRNGRLAGLLCLTQGTPREWTSAEVALLQETAERTWAAVERAQAEEDLRHSEEQFRLLVTATSDVVYRMGADWTQLEQLAGKDFLADTQDPSHTWVIACIPAGEQAPVQAAIAGAIRHRRLFELEHRVRRADGTLGWVSSRAIPVLGAQGELTGWLGTARDVSARHEAAQQLRESASLLEHRVAEHTRELRESRDLLHAIAESQAAFISAFQAVRDEQGRLVDLEFLFANSATSQLVPGAPLVGQRYLAMFPQMVELGLWKTFCHVAETGETVELEQVNEAGPVGWFHVIASRLGDGLLVCSQDITARKQAEQERSRLLRLLEQAEQVASMGSWDYEPATGRLIWSAGMYRLFGLAADPVGPDRCRRAAVPADQPIAERLLGYLLAGTEAFEETLRLRIERLEAENVALQLGQQQALLLAILQAQETERSRLAERLHNGLGQLLYAIKLQLSQLDLPALPALDGVRVHADRLLADAIQQTRPLSHELMPTRLLERGLAAALRDICRDLTTPQLTFTCHVWLQEPVLLPLPLQTALYRLSQELAHNIAEHAQASQAALEVELLPGWAVLRAEDNGRGFDPPATAHGLGLRLLHEAVDLLGGTIALDSSPECGTHIRLRIPIPLKALWLEFFWLTTMPSCAMACGPCSRPSPGCK